MSGADDTHLLEKLGDTDLRLADPREDVRGHAVLDAAGERLGRVEELIVDRARGRVRFLQVGGGGFLGLGREHSLIPVDAIEAVGEGEVRIRDSRARVGEGPDYAPEQGLDRAYQEGLYGHYGLRPFWSPGYQHPAVRHPEGEAGFGQPDLDRRRADYGRGGDPDRPADDPMLR